MSFGRYREVLAAYQIQPFERLPHRFGPKVNGELLPLRWRVSRDEWDRVKAEAEAIAGEYTYASDSTVFRLFGWPIEPDDDLPPNSIILDRSAVRTAVGPTQEASE